MQSLFAFSADAAIELACLLIVVALVAVVCA